MWPGTRLTLPPPSGAPASLGPRATRRGERRVKQNLRPPVTAPGAWVEGILLGVPTPVLEWARSRSSSGLLNLKARGPGFLHSLVIFKA